MYGRETIRESVRPLTAAQIQEYYCSRLGYLSRVNGREAVDLEKIFGEIREHNVRSLTDRRKPVCLGIVLYEGCLGEMVRATHWIPLIREWSGQEPLIFTSHPQIFAGNKTVTVEEHSRNGHFLDVYSLVLGNARTMEPGRGDWDLILMDLKYYHQYYHRYNRGRQIMHLLHGLQIASYELFGKTVETFPAAEISFSPAAHQEAANLVESLDIVASQVPLLVYLDASKGMFSDKRWQFESYWSVLRNLRADFGEKMRVVILTGVDHPWESEQLVDVLGHRIPYVRMEQIPDIGILGAFLEKLAQKGAVMLGTDSFVPGHLFPIVGGWSVVLGWDFTNGGRGHNYYRPVEEGCVTLENRNHGFPSPEQVQRALALRVGARLSTLTQ